jgi:hypothetical protein
MALPGIPGTVFVHPVLILIAADNVEMFNILGSANNVSPTCCLLKRAGEDGEEEEEQDGLFKDPFPFVFQNFVLGVVARLE